MPLSIRGFSKLPLSRLVSQNCHFARWLLDYYATSLILVIFFFPFPFISTGKDQTTPNSRSSRGKNKPHKHLVDVACPVAVVARSARSLSPLALVPARHSCSVRPPARRSSLSSWSHRSAGTRRREGASQEDEEVEGYGRVAMEDFLSAGGSSSGRLCTCV